MPTFGYFGQKMSNFNLVTKFCLYFILRVLISYLILFFENFEPKLPNMGILGQKVSIFTFTKFCLYLISKVLISNLTFAFCGPQQPSTKLTRTNSMFPFCNLFGKRFFVFLFCKSLKILWPQLLFFEFAYYKYDKKV